MAIGALLLAYVCTAPAAATPGAETEPFAITGFTTQTTEPSASDKTANEPYSFDQAGGHPFALTSTVRFAAGDPKDVIVDLPAGLLANPQVTPRCPGVVEHCPADTQVGMFALRFAGGEQRFTVIGPIVNMTPYSGVPAELGLEVPILGRVLLTGRIVYTAQGYTLAIVGRGLPVLNLPGLVPSGSPPLRLTSLETTLWGVPAASAHDPQRGLSCVSGLGIDTDYCLEEGGLSSGAESAPFLTMPSACPGTPPTALAWADSWEQPGQFTQAQSTLPAMAGCEGSPFEPEVSVRPETVAPGAPDGIDLTIKVPQHEQTIAAAPELRDATIALPRGMAIDPSVATGLQGCDATGPSGIDIPTGLNSNGEALRPDEVGPGEAIPSPGLGPEEPWLAAGDCPDASIVGTAEATTPLLAHPIQGRVYIATPGCGGPGLRACTDMDALDGNLYRLYVQLGAGADTKQNEGVLLKLAATVQANPANGQLSVRLQESPQLPLGELSLHLFGGEHALLTNPTACGPATTTTDLEPWSSPYSPDASPSSYYDVEGCPSPQPFHPTLLAGSLDATAGAYSPFMLTVTRTDGEQDLAGLQVHAPQGLSAALASVPVCPDSLASSGDCPESSRIGGSQVTAGTGAEPLQLPGDVYLTGPYEDAPFGLAIVTNATAGPLNLGRLVVRAQISIDPHTAALTITSDPLPQIVLGIPLRIQRISLTLDRPHFILNPTSCEEQHVTATIASIQATGAQDSNPYALAGCRSLAFKPKLIASTTAHTSLANGASLDVKLGFPEAQAGTQANLARIKIALPKQLPTRLTSLQHSCPGTQFSANPAHCPSVSIIGIARARTPILTGELEGPVYMVSHGPDTLPSPNVVLQSNNIVLELPGSTTIGKTGASSVAFDATPDIPLENIELFLPTGPDSLLAANTGLCAPGKTITTERRLTKRVHGRTVHRIVRVRERLAATLPLRTELAAHNGAILHQTAQIAVAGCTPGQLGIRGGPRPMSRPASAGHR